VLEEALLRFEGKRLFFEGKRAFSEHDTPKAIELLRKSNNYLHSLRITSIVLLMRTMPTVARRAYLWRSRILGD
jgi:hypothetical protein